MLRSGQKKKKPYSIATTSILMERKNQIGFYIKQEGSGGCSEYLTQHIEIGENVLIKGAVGHYIDNKDSKNYLFISTGSGLAPNFSMMQGLQHSKDYRKIAFLFGERDETYLTTNVLQTLEKGIQDNHEKEYFKICYSQEKEKKTYPYTSGYVQSEIVNAIAFLGNPSTINAFLCGKPEMVEQSILHLSSLNISKEQITVEKY